jgi:cation/acetate symporter
VTAIVCFIALVIATLAITGWAARRSQGRSGVYAADGALGPTQNGFAIAGDFLSASTFLGTTALFFTAGVDMILYLAPFLFGLCLMLIWIVGPLRKLGRYTLGDVLAARLPSRGLRIYIGLSTITISIAYLIAQLVGAGMLIAILFGLPFEWAVVIVGVLMTVYVAFGGMLAASWVQIIKAGLLIGTVVIICVLALVNAGGVGELYERAAAIFPRGAQLFQFGGLNLSMLSTISLVVGVAAGTMGLPHILIRAFTVRDALAAQRSIAVGATVIAIVVSLVFAIVAPATVAFVTGDPAYQTQNGVIRGGTNMVVVHLAAALGGEVLLGIVAAVTFATILAVVSGLTIAVASASAHDLYASLHEDKVDERRELRVFRAATIASSAAAVALAILFKDQNIAVLIAMALGVAASANFPVLFLAIYWRRLTARGALIGGAVGLISALVLIVLGPEVWVRVLGNPQAISPLEYPALISTPLAFVTAWVVSVLDPQKPTGDERVTTRHDSSFAESSA